MSELPNSPPTSLQVTVHDEQGVIFAGEATAISSINQQGTFDILPDHTNFITLITQTLTVHLAAGEPKRFAVASGILHCFTSKVEVYLGLTSKRVATKK